MRGMPRYRVVGCLKGAATLCPAHRGTMCRHNVRCYSGVGSASLAIQLTLDTLFSMLMRLAINSSFD